MKLAQFCIKLVFHLTCRNNGEVNISHENTTVVVWICFGKFRSSSGCYNFAQIVSYIYLYCEVLFLQGHSTCFGRKRPSSGVFKTSTAATGTCVFVAGQSSHLVIRASGPNKEM